MFLFRITHCDRIRDLTGTGGLYASGRWHSKGTKIVYFSEHVSLAKLEVLVNSSFIPKNVCLLTIQLPQKIGITSLALNQLPQNWDRYPHIDALKKITSRWLAEGQSLFLKVPSAQSYHEFNYLLNPLHEDISKIKIESVESVTFDKRLEL